jgi:hypothetical protein
VHAHFPVGGSKSLHCGTKLHLTLSDPAYTERLATFLESLGQSTIVAGPGQVELVGEDRSELVRSELRIYLKVWGVLYPDAKVTVSA